MVTITSKDNPRLKEYRKLCTSKKYRAESGRFALEGVRLICDYVKSGKSIITLIVSAEGQRRLGESFDLVCAKAGEVIAIPDALALSLGDTQSPQGAFAVCGESVIRQGLPKSAENGILMLCSLQDPGNVGTILRSAEAFGLDAVILTGDCPDAASPKVLRASMGAAFRIPIYETADAKKAIAELRSRKIPVYAAALGEKSAPVDAVSLYNAAVVIGNEGAGLPDDVADSCDSRVILPIEKTSESLNAAMAATVFAWELSKAARQKGRV